MKASCSTRRKKTSKPQRYQLIVWTDDLRIVIDHWLALRAKLRGGQKKVDDLASAPLFLNRKGKAVTETGFNSMWQRGTRAAGFGAHEFHFHDIKAKSVSDSPDEIDAMNRGGAHRHPHDAARLSSKTDGGHSAADGEQETLVAFGNRY